MLKYFIGGLVTGGLVVGLLATLPVHDKEKKIADENSYLHQLRITMLTGLMVETCFFDEVDADALSARLEPVGYLQLFGSQSGSAHFAGGLGGRILYSKSAAGQFCSASLNTGANPSTEDLCRTAIHLHWGLWSHLRQAELEKPSIPYEVRHIGGLKSVQTFKEKCTTGTEQFSWEIDRDGVLFDVKLAAVPTVKEPAFLYAGYLPGAGYRFSIHRRLLE